MSKKKEEIDIKDIKEKIRTAIHEKHKMSIYEFCRSPIPKLWGLNYVPEILDQYLTDNGATSFGVYQVLYNELGLGELTRQTTRVVKTKFYITVKTKKDGGTESRNEKSGIE